MEVVLVPHYLYLAKGHDRRCPPAATLVRRLMAWMASDLRVFGCRRRRSTALPLSQRDPFVNRR